MRSEDMALVVLLVGIWLFSAVLIYAWQFGL
jgi:hypothetical protein